MVATLCLRALITSGDGVDATGSVQLLLACSDVLLCTAANIAELRGFQLGLLLTSSGVCWQVEAP